MAIELKKRYYRKKPNCINRVQQKSRYACHPSKEFMQPIREAVRDWLNSAECFNNDLTYTKDNYILTLNKFICPIQDALVNGPNSARAVEKANKQYTKQILKKFQLEEVA